jgi:hypothetical protein
MHRAKLHNYGTQQSFPADFPLLVARNWHGAPVVKEIVCPVGAEATDTRTQWFQSQAAYFYDTVYRSWSHDMTNVSIPVANTLKKAEHLLYLLQ